MFFREFPTNFIYLYGYLNKLYKDKEITSASHADKYFAGFIILLSESRMHSHQCFKI